MRRDSVPFEHPWDEALVCEMANVIVGGTPSTAEPSFWDGEIRWMASGDVHQHHIFDVPGRISEKGLRCSNAVVVEPQAVAIALAGQGKTRGTVALTHVPICTNQSVALIKPRDNQLDPEFLYQSLIPRYEEMRARSAGGGRAGLTKAILESLPIQFPHPHEQRRIAEILSTLDDAIEQTEALIAKHQQIKTGLMHDLFTCGVTADGHLRPTREQAPNIYKDTMLGWIPKEWEVESIDSLAVRVGSGITPTGGSEVYLTEGIIFVRSQNVTHQGLDLSDVAFIDEETHQRMAASEVLPFDVLLNITGASIGRCCYLPNGLGPTNTNQHVCCIRFARPNETDAKFLSMVLSSPIGQNQIFRLNAGGNREGLNYQQLRAFIVPWPQQDERLKIAVRLNSAEGHISVERQLLIKLRQQKHGLMHDLLTGRVRVKV